MNKFIKCLCIGIMCLFATGATANAEAVTNYIDLETMAFSTNGKDYKTLKEYNELEGFFE